MKVGNINSNQNFGMRIPHTDALGEVIHSWRKSGVSQKDINKKLANIKRILSDSFEIKIEKLNKDFGPKETQAQYSIIFKDGTKFTDISKISAYDFVKRIKESAQKAKAKIIELKGPKAVTGKGIY